MLPFSLKSKSAQYCWCTAAFSVYWNISRKMFAPRIRLSVGNFRTVCLISVWVTSYHWILSMDFLSKIQNNRFSRYWTVQNFGDNLFETDRILTCLKDQAPAWVLSVGSWEACGWCLFPGLVELLWLFLLSFVVRANDLSHWLASVWVPESSTSACRRWLKRKVSFTWSSSSSFSLLLINFPSNEMFFCKRVWGFLESET